MRSIQSTKVALLAAIFSFSMPATCIHVQNTTQSTSTASSISGTGAIVSSSETPSSACSASSTKPATTQKHVPFGMIVRESGAITLTWRQCGEGLSTKSTTSSTSSSASTANTETVTDLEVFPTIIPDPEPPATTLTDLEVFPTIVPDLP
ncbi:hypothetical protein V8F33_003705 [Rhypophila sp. PSN 637]